MFLSQQVLSKRKYSDNETAIALYEASPLMRRRQAETLLNQSVGVIRRSIDAPENLFRWIR